MIRKDTQTSELALSRGDIPIEKMFRHLKSLNPDPNASSGNFGKFVIKRPLCGGSQSAVLLAFDPDLRREVVIKVYSPDLSRDQKSMVLEEGRALSQIKSKHVAGCLSVDTLEDCPYLVLEYVPGHPLDRLSLPLESDTALEIVRQIALAVAAVHDRGILHLDLKPSNVMLADDGTVKLIDFGLAQPFSNVSFGHVSGTPAFMAPEVAEHDVSLIDRRADIFGVGAILYYLLTGQVLFEGENREDVIQAAKKCQIRPLSEFVANVSPTAKQLCEKCLKKNPAERYASIEMLQEVLPQARRRRFMKWTAAALALGMLATAGWFVWPKTPAPPLEDHAKALAQLMAGDQTTSIKQDFALTLEIRRADGSSVPTDGVLHLTAGEKIQIFVKPAFESWIGVFSVEFSDQKSNYREIVPIPKGENYVVRVKGEETKKFDLTLFPTPPGQEEYFVILARDRRWSAKALIDDARSLGRTIKPESRVNRGARGISQTEQGAGIIVRYNVTH